MGADQMTIRNGVTNQSEMSLTFRLIGCSFLFALMLMKNAYAHDPVFSPGPHVIYQGGIEIHTEIFTEKVGNLNVYGPALRFLYGLTGNWLAGIIVPYRFKHVAGNNAQGIGDTQLFTKYRFWRKDTLGAQESAALLLRVKIPTASNNTNPMLGTGTTDVIPGLTYGYEGRRWYRWASARYRHNGTKNGLHPGNKWLFDIVGGVRPWLTEYHEWDYVFMLELNTEVTQHTTISSIVQPNTGGVQLFLSPGTMITKRNFAIKAGIQIPVYQHLYGNQPKTDYRAIIIAEWHL